MTRQVPKRLQTDAVLDMETGSVRCPRCGHVEKLPLPMPISALKLWVHYFHEVHRYCEKEMST